MKGTRGAGRVAAPCEMCGRSLSDHDRHIRFELPDPVLESDLKLNTPGSWSSHESAFESVMMQVPGVGPFVRALLPIRFTGDHTLTYGVWVSISPADLQRTIAVWWSEDYKDLALDGLLANNIPRWGLLGTPVRLVVRDSESTPYCVSSADPLLSSVLSLEWPLDEFSDGPG